MRRPWDLTSLDRVYDAVVSKTPEAHWSGVWQSRPDTDLSWFEDHPETSVALIRDLEPRLGASIIDVGGGAARLVDHLLVAGYTRVTVLDVSADALAIARRRLGGRAADVTWVEADLLSHRFRGTVDLWHDRAVLHFLTDGADRDRYVQQLSDAVVPGGHAVIAAFADDGPDSCSGLPVRRYTAGELRTLLDPAFTPLDVARHEHVTPDGVKQSFVYGSFKRRQADT